MKKTENSQEKKNYIEVAGVKYNVRMTMGVLLSFKKETGRDLEKFDESNLEDSAILLYCICKSSARVDKKEFPFSSHEEFADHISFEQLNSIDLQFK